MSKVWVEQLPSGNYSGRFRHPLLYLRQTARENNAAVVALGETKPTSVYSMEQVSGQAVTVAHLSEPIARQHLADHQGLVRFLSAELGYGLQREVERILVSGSGTGEEPAGILNTTGVRHQSYGADPLATIRSALTLLATAGESPTAIVLSPTAWENVELLRDANARFLLQAAPTGSAARALWGVPVVLHPQLADDTALVGDLRTVHLFTREAMRLDWTEAGPDLFDRNMLKARCETRIGLALSRPGALATVELAAAA